MLLPFISVNLRLVHSIALQYQGMGLELDDLVYEGENYIWECKYNFFNSEESKIFTEVIDICRSSRAEESFVQIRSRKRIRVQHICLSLDKGIHPLSLGIIVADSFT